MDETVKSKRAPKGPVKLSVTLSEEQKTAKANILNSPVNFILGKAGSGKTLLACAIALDLYFKRDIHKIVITRPTISTEDNGFLPGTEKEKLDPWLVPIRSNMLKVYNKKEIIEKMEKENSIEIVSLTHFRGRTFENCVCIIDEFQNLTKRQFAMALGRLGKGSTLIFCGDFEQIDLPYRNESAVHDVAKLRSSKYCYEIILQDNHRHEALDEIFKLLNEVYPK